MIDDTNVISIINDYYDYFFSSSSFSPSCLPYAPARLVSCALPHADL